MIYLKILILFPIFVFAVEPNHLLLSRIVIAPDNAESISIINPTDESINLYPYGYPHSFVSNQLHQYIMIFRKKL